MQSNAMQSNAMQSRATHSKAPRVTHSMSGFPEWFYHSSAAQGNALHCIAQQGIAKQSKANRVKHSQSAFPNKLSHDRLEYSSLVLTKPKVNTYEHYLCKRQNQRS